MPVQLHDVIPAEQPQEPPIDIDVRQEEEENQRNQNDEEVEINEPRIDEENDANASVSNAILLRELVQQQMRAHEQNRELLLQGLANLTETSSEIKTQTSSLQQGLVTLQEVMLQQLSNINTSAIQGSPPSTVSNNEPSSRDTASVNNPASTTSTISRVVMTPPEVPPRFRDTGTYNPIIFLQDLEKYFKKTNTSDDHKLEVVIDCLDGPARNWATIYRRVWRSFNDFREAFINTYWSQLEQAKLRNRIFTETWSNRHTMSNHFAYFVSMAEQLTNPLPDEELVGHLMRHFPTHLQSLWSLTNKRTLTDAADFIRQQENIVLYRNTSAKSKAPPAKATTQRTYQPYQPHDNRRTQINAIQFVPSTSSPTSSGNAYSSDQ